MHLERWYRNIVATIKRIHSKIISKKIVDIISQLDSVKSCMVGDLDKLPSPQHFKKFLPAVFVKPSTVHQEWADDSPVSGIINQTYNFKIIYVKHNDLEKQEEQELLEIVMQDGEALAEHLMEHDLLDNLVIENCDIFGSLVNNIDFDSNTYQIFKDLQIPATVCEMDMEVYVRSRRK
jgi:hypothetical protein